MFELLIESLNVSYAGCHILFEGPRAARSGELQKIIDLVNEIFMTQRGLPPIMGDAFPLLFNRNNLENLRIIVKDGQPISHVGIWEGDLLIFGSWFKVGMIGSVCTREDFRGRGYASALIMDAIQKMTNDGIDLVLISGDRNLYKRLGFFKSGLIYNYNIPYGKLEVDQNKLNFICYDESLLKDVVAIYQKEPVRYRRSLEEFNLLLKIFTKPLKYTSIKNRIYLAVVNDRPLAYIATSLFIETNFLKIWEYAGSRNAIIHLIEYLFKTMHINNLEVTVPFHDAEMLGLLEKYGINRPPLNSEASMLILNSKRFFENAKYYLIERLGAELASRIEVRDVDGKIMLFLGDEDFTLEKSEFTLLFFDSPEKERPREKIEPIRKFLGEALPMPTPIYGLNYI